MSSDVALEKSNPALPFHERLAARVADRAKLSRARTSDCGQRSGRRQSALPIS